MPRLVNTFMIDYQLNYEPTEDQLTQSVIEPFQKLSGAKFELLLKNEVKNRLTLSFQSDNSNGKDILILIRRYNKADSKEKTLLSITAEAPDSFDEIIYKTPGMDLEDTIKDALDENFPDSEPTHYPAIKRCIPDSPYLRTCDDRLVEYGFKKVVYSARSEYQKIQIVDTVDFGRLLILDDMTNLAETDTLPYTHTLMNLPKEDYEGKEVLILGGGDGALMNELQKLDKPPKFVTMIDIDEMVMDACNEFMPSVCGPYLRKDNREGPTHKIIVGDAVAFLENCLKEKRVFDVIFGDLTDTPVSTSPLEDNVWEFIRSIISMGMKLLRPKTGKYLTHANGKTLQEAIDAYERMVTGINGGQCQFRRWENYVPSFSDTWLFYELTNKD